jgi:hypothetical protein
LLLERTSTVVSTWLQQHPSVEIVTRDRSTEYAAGITAGEPQAQQVADRWHLLLNLRQMLDRFFSTIYLRVQQLPLAPQHLALLSQQRVAFRRTRSEQIATQNSRDKRLANMPKFNTYARRDTTFPRLPTSWDITGKRFVNTMKQPAFQNANSGDQGTAFSILFYPISNNDFRKAVRMPCSYGEKSNSGVIPVHLARS